MDRRTVLRIGLLGGGRVRGRTIARGVRSWRPARIRPDRCGEHCADHGCRPVDAVVAPRQLRAGHARGRGLRPRTSRERSRPSSPASTCATARTPSRAGRRTGSSATAWCTASCSSDGKANWYRNRYVHTTLLAAGGGLTAKGAPGGASSQSNVSVVHHGGKLLTLGEVGLPVRAPRRRPVDGRRLRLRRAARRQHDRAPEDRSRDRARCTSSATASPSRTSRTTSPIATARWSSSQPVAGEGVDDDPRLRDHRPRRRSSGSCRSCST